MIIKKGDKGLNIYFIDELFNTITLFINMLEYNCYYPLEDKVFDGELEYKVKLFQEALDLTCDGIIGPVTQRKLIETIIKFMEGDFDSFYKINEDLKEAPLYKDLFKVFSDFRESDWAQKNLILCDLSKVKDQYEHVKLGWELNIPAFQRKDGSFGFYCHKKVANKFQKVFIDIAKNNLAKEIKTFDGCWHVRWKRKSKTWSTHSWGIAIDLNAFENRMGTKGNIHPRIVEIFKEHGFTWGGDWEHPDPMHFQYCRE